MTKENTPDGFIPPHGGYQNMLSYKKTVIIYLATVRFCERFFRRYDRTAEQMVSAARSGKQNLVEGSMASGTSKSMEIKLVNVARASQAELLEDYQDFLKARNAPIWDKDSREALFVRKLGANRDASYETFREFIDTRSPEIVANILICLINQANYLIDKQKRQLEKAFVQDGGLRERMTRARINERNRQNNPFAQKTKRRS